MARLGGHLLRAAAPRSRRTNTSPTGRRAPRPREVGKRVAEAFIPAPHMDMSSHGPQALHYSHVATWTGALQFAGAHQGRGPQEAARRSFRSVPAANGTRVPRADHVDGTVFGALPLELYMQDARFRYRVMGLAFADAQWDRPAARRPLPPDALVDRRHVHDHRAAARGVPRHGDAKYLERATQSMVAYLAKLQQPNGLFFHAPDVPFYWGRGDGWVAVGMAELLRDLPREAQVCTRRCSRPIAA